MKADPKPYKPWQYFFWMLSGSEISILKKCPTDYNRHAGIGFTILMTSVFGAFAGGYAGYYFTNSAVGAIAFGLLWGLLIFSIDRTMVVSLKKRPDTKWYSHFWQILFRAILAALIAFIISIPLELLIFRDNIDAGQSFYNQDQLLKLKNGQNALFDPKGDSARIAAEEQKMEKSDSISRLDPTDPGFKTLVNESNSIRQNLNSLRSNLNTAFANSKRSYNASFVVVEEQRVLDRNSSSYRNYLASKKQERQLRQEIGVLNNSLGNLTNQIQQRRNEWKVKHESLRDSARNRADMVNKEMVIEKAKMDSSNQKFDKTLEKIQQSFVVRFDVLTFLANKKNTDGSREFASIFFLLWLVRVLFFVIEILPTIVKVATPFGAYDMVIFEEEENFRNIKLPAAREALKTKIAQENEMEKKERDRQLAKRLEKEGILHDEILEEVSEAQNQIAKSILEEWKQKHIHKKTTKAFV